MCCLWGFPGGMVVENLPANAGDRRDSGLIPGMGQFPGGGNGNPLQCSCLGNLMDRGDWWATVHGIEESDTAEHTHTQAHTPWFQSPSRVRANVPDLTCGLE